MSTKTDSAVDPTQPVPPELAPTVEHLVTEDDTPVDNIFSEKQQRLLTEPLYSSWNRSPFVAMANVGLFYSVHRPRYVPDVLLSLDVSAPADPFPKKNRSYFVWEYGKPPEVVIEIVSNRIGGEDTEKLQGYARIGIPYYAIFDPDCELSHEVLRVYRSNGRYVPMPAPIWFAAVELGLQLWRGTFEGVDAEWLRWVDREGQPLMTGFERAELERRRANEECQRADAAHQRANEERQRTERLAEQLRELGVDPQV